MSWKTAYRSIYYAQAPEPVDLELLVYVMHGPCEVPGGVC
jgi:hypothetical protein